MRRILACQRLHPQVSIPNRDFGVLKYFAIVAGWLASLVSIPNRDFGVLKYTHEIGQVQGLQVSIPNRDFGVLKLASVAALDASRDFCFNP